VNPVPLWVPLLQLRGALDASLTTADSAFVVAAAAEKTALEAQSTLHDARLGSNKTSHRGLKFEGVGDSARVSFRAKWLLEIFEGAIGVDRSRPTTSTLTTPHTALNWAKNKFWA
jgi:hypothetical protein